MFYCWVIKDNWIDHFWCRCVWGKHPFPSRTRRLRPNRPMVLHWRRCGRAGGRQIHKKEHLWVMRDLKRFKFLMTDKSSVKKTRCEPQEQSSFGHGITCQCMKKQLCSGKRACLCRIVFQALASLCTLKTAYELINSQIYRDKTSEVIVILKSNKNF